MSLRSMQKINRPSVNLKRSRGAACSILHLIHQRILCLPVPSAITLFEEYSFQISGPTKPFRTLWYTRASRLFVIKEINRAINVALSLSLKQGTKLCHCNGIFTNVSVMPRQPSLLWIPPLSLVKRTTPFLTLYGQTSLAWETFTLTRFTLFSKISRAYESNVNTTKSQL